MKQDVGQRPLADLTFESVARDHYEVTHQDVAGRFATPMAKHPVIHVKGHPEVVWVRPDMGVGSVATSIAFGVGSHPSPIPWRQVTRTLTSGYLPIVVSQWKDGALLYRQTAFCRIVAGGDVRTGHEKQAVFVEMSVSNTETSGRRHGSLWAFVPAEVPAKGIPPFPYNTYDLFEINGTLPALSGHPVFAEDDLLRHKSLFVGIYSADAGIRAVLFDQALQFRFNLAPGEKRSLHLIFSSNANGFTSNELDVLRKTKFQDALKERIAYLEHLLSKGAQISVPDARLNDIYKSQILYNHAQFLQAADRPYSLSVQGFQGVWPWEAMKALMPFDAMGYHDDVRKNLAYFLKIQDRFLPHGDFKKSNGVFGGTIGYEESGWEQDNQSTLVGQLAKLNAGKEKEFPNWMNGTGAMLHTFASHYFYTRDEAWLREVAPALIRAAHWIISERQATKQKDKDGQKALHYGLLPIGRAYDTAEEAIKHLVSEGAMRDGEQTEGQSPLGTYYPAWTDAYSSQGLSAFSQALLEIGHAEGPRLMAEANEYREDIAEVMRRTRSHEAGAPPFPERLYRPPAWAEFATGSLAYFDAGFIDANDDAIPHLERYMRERWNRGALGLTGGMDQAGDPYANDSYYVNFSEDLWHRAWILRGEIEKALLAFHSTLAYGMDQEVYGTVERFHLREPRYCPFYMDTSASSRICAMILNSLVLQSDGKLWLMAGVPRRWLQDGSKFCCKKVCLPLGLVDMRTQSDLASQKIRIDFLLDHVRKEHVEIRLRIPHPERSIPQKVLVNGKEENFDAAKETVDFSVIAGQHRVDVYY